MKMKKTEQIKVSGWKNLSYRELLTIFMICGCTASLDQDR